MPESTLTIPDFSGVATAPPEAPDFSVPSLPDLPDLAPAAPPWPKRGRRLQIDAKAVVTSLTKWVDDVIQDADRGEWYARRLDRMAKYRGWLTEKTTPWIGASNVFFPMLQTAELRVNAGLHNVIMTMRPLCSAVATNAANTEKQARITDLLDTQVFLDPGPERAERVWSDYVSAFGQDGNAVLFCPWVRQEEAITEVLFRPPVPPEQTPDEYLYTRFSEIFQSEDAERDATVPNRYRVRYREQDRPEEAVVDVFLADDDTVELVVKRTVTLYDGPIAQPVPLDDLFVPTRCTNLQPPSGWNPRGAGRVVVRDYLTVDAIRRNKDSGDFNWLDAKGMTLIEEAARALMGPAPEAGADGTALKVQGDQLEGHPHRQPADADDRDDDAALGGITLPVWRCFDRWDVDGDGLLEDTYWIIVPDAGPEGTLCEARLLRERWPSVRAYRPLAEAVCIPVKDRWYGISLLELGESLQDTVKATFDMMFDASSIAKRPFFFYNSGAWKGQFDIALGPAEGYPVAGQPRDQIYFPTIPAGDQQWAFQVIGIVVQAFERLMMLGDLQLGRVPQGKASALRTYGTTAALLQQGDVRADQMLLRLFGGIRQVYDYFHRMNRHLLPPGKEVRRLGWDGDERQAYVTFAQGRADVDADVDFEFRPDFLNSSAEVLAGALESMVGLIATPLAIQMGIVDPTTFYTALKDLFRAKKLDYRKYLKPPTPDGGIPIFAEDAIAAILSDTLPTGTVPAEGMEAHAKKLFAFLQSEHFGLLAPAQAELFKAYLAALGQRHQREQLAAQAKLFQPGASGPPGGDGQPAGQVPAFATGPDATGQPVGPMPGPPNANGGGG